MKFVQKDIKIMVLAIFDSLLKNLENWKQKHNKHYKPNGCWTISVCDARPCVSENIEHIELTIGFASAFDISSISTAPLKNKKKKHQKSLYYRTQTP